jgi:hypothetical protein
VFGHPALVDQSRDVTDVDPAPDAFRLAMGVALQKTLVVKALALAIDPAPAKHDVDGFLRCDRLQPRIHLVDLDPDFVFLVVVLAEPLVKTLRILERTDLVGIDFDGRHQRTSRFVS